MARISSVARVCQRQLGFLVLVCDCIWSYRLYVAVDAQVEASLGRGRQTVDGDG